jgi:hypothetical protein
MHLEGWATTTVYPTTARGLPRAIETALLSPRDMYPWIGYY